MLVSLEVEGRFEDGDAAFALVQALAAFRADGAQCAGDRPDHDGRPGGAHQGTESDRAEPLRTVGVGVGDGVGASGDVRVVPVPREVPGDGA